MSSKGHKRKGDKTPTPPKKKSKATPISPAEQRICPHCKEPSPIPDSSIPALRTKALNNFAQHKIRCKAKREKKSKLVIKHDTPKSESESPKSDPESSKSESESSKSESESSKSESESSKSETESPEVELSDTEYPTTEKSSSTVSESVRASTKPLPFATARNKAEKALKGAGVSPAYTKTIYSKKKGDNEPEEESSSVMSLTTDESYFEPPSTRTRRKSKAQAIKEEEFIRSSKSGDLISSSTSSSMTPVTPKGSKSKESLSMTPGIKPSKTETIAEFIEATSASTDIDYTKAVLVCRTKEDNYFTQIPITQDPESMLRAALFITSEEIRTERIYLTESYRRSVMNLGHTIADKINGLETPSPSGNKETIALVKLKHALITRGIDQRKLPTYKTDTLVAFIEDSRNVAFDNSTNKKFKQTITISDAELYSKYMLPTTKLTDNMFGLIAEHFGKTVEVYHQVSKPKFVNPLQCEREITFTCENIEPTFRLESTAAGTYLPQVEKQPIRLLRSAAGTFDALILP